MKTLILLLLCPLLLSSSNIQTNNGLDTPGVLDGSIRIYCVPDLLDITRDWADEFITYNPKVDIKIIMVTETSLDWVLNKSGSICIVPANYFNQLKNDQQWSMVIGRDVIVPIINSENPYSGQLHEKGISQEALSQLTEEPEMRYWNSIISGEQNTPIHLYIANEGSSTALLSHFLDMERADIEGITVENSEALVAAVQRDPLALGFCSYKNILDPVNQSLYQNISILAVDKNGNGKIDYIEQIYNDPGELMRGVWIGKYPMSLVSSIYAVSTEKPNAAIDLAFLKWVISDGQQQLSMAGYSDLTLSEQVTRMNLLENSPVEINPIGLQTAYSRNIIILIFTSVVLLFIVIALTRRYSLRKYAEIKANYNGNSLFDKNTISAPGGIFYDKSHTWAFMEKNGKVKVGIDDFLQHITGPITALKLKKEGDKISKGDQVLSIVQNGKQISLYSPVSGTIEERNAVLNTTPSNINTSPYMEGWVYMIKPANWLWDAQSLLFGNACKEWLNDEFSRFKDFLAAFVKPENLSYAQTVLQDGGEIKDNILAELGPEAWEDFQRNFIDNSR